MISQPLTVLDLLVSEKGDVQRVLFEHPTNKSCNHINYDEGLCEVLNGETLRDFGLAERDAWPQSGSLLGRAAERSPLLIPHVCEGPFLWVYAEPGGVSPGDFL